MLIFHVGTTASVAALNSLKKGRAKKKFPSFNNLSK
jgi:hypothetical protein